MDVLKNILENNIKTDLKMLNARYYEQLASKCRSSSTPRYKLQAVNGKMGKLRLESAAGFLGSGLNFSK